MMNPFHYWTKKWLPLLTFLIGALCMTWFFRTDNPIRMYFYKLKEKRDVQYRFYSMDTLANQKDSVKKFYSNDFEFVFDPKIYPKITKKTCGLILRDNRLVVYEQDDIFKIWKEYGLDSILPNIEPAVDENGGESGGARKVFEFKNNLFALLTLKEKNSTCFFASIINLTQRREVFRAPCLPDYKPPTIDFNEIGGGYAEYKGNLLFALGAPSVYGKNTENLNQDLKSPYGKILRFTKQQLIDGNVSKSSFEIFSIGHRNIQGMLNLNDEIFAVEHGPRGGDEINLIEQHKNYGWPIVSLGLTYEFENIYAPVGDTAKFTLPLFSFIPSVATSDIIDCPQIIKKRFYPLESFLISSLRGQSLFIVLFTKENHRIISVEKIDTHMRIRQFCKNAGDRLIVSTDGYGAFEISVHNLLDMLKK
jgi:aldose sugar dehydrogenase